MQLQERFVSIANGSEPRDKVAKFVVYALKLLIILSRRQHTQSRVKGVVKVLSDGRKVGRLLRCIREIEPAKAAGKEIVVSIQRGKAPSLHTCVSFSSSFLGAISDSIDDMCLLLQAGGGEAGKRLAVVLSKIGSYFFMGGVLSDVYLTTIVLLKRMEEMKKHNKLNNRVEAEKARRSMVAACFLWVKFMSDAVKAASDMQGGAGDTVDTVLGMVSASAALRNLLVS